LAEKEKSELQKAHSLSDVANGKMTFDGALDRKKPMSTFIQ
jgi:hypothetical protein